MTMKADKGRQPASQVNDSPQSQSERFIAKAREMGLDEREEAFDAALTKVARHKGSKQDADLSEDSSEALDR